MSLARVFKLSSCLNSYSGSTISYLIKSSLISSRDCCLVACSLKPYVDSETYFSMPIGASVSFSFDSTTGRCG